MREVKGEIPLFDKLLPFLEIAQNWFCRYFAPEDMLDSIPYAAGIVAVEAYRLALPNLDLVLTPNGFATVGTQNLSPASKMRVDRLIDALRKERDKALELILPTLPAVDGWTESPQGKWFGTTLFNTFEIVQQTTAEDNSWDEYLKLRPKIIELEESIAVGYISPELFTALRYENINGLLTGIRNEIVIRLKTLIINALNKGSINLRSLTDIVDVIRKYPENFKEWHTSTTAELFNPPVFKNDKKNAGYFF